MADIKVCVIGAGSAVFSLNLVRDLVLTPSLYGSCISLVDVNVERLNAVYALMKRLCEEVGAKYKLEKAVDRRKALRDADFVVNTALAAGHSRLRDGWAVARDLGYRFGGSLHVMHDEAFWINFYQFKLFEEVIEDVLDLCPDAWYIQLANPVLAGITLLGRKYPEANIVGLCHGYTGAYYLADAIGLDPAKVEFTAPGLNHFIWLTEIRVDGEDAYPKVNDWVNNKAVEHWKKCYPSDALGPKAVDLYRRFKVFPIGDTCTPGGGSWPWWYHVDEERERKWHEDPESWWASYFAWLNTRVSEVLKVAEDPSAKVTENFPLEKSGEDTVPLIESIACNFPRKLQVNVVNRGYLVPGIPADFEVEVPAIVDGRGVRGLEVECLPKPVLAFALRDRVAPVEMELEAYEGGNKEQLVELVLTDPWTRSSEQAEQLVEKILRLPFHVDMPKHYG
ncbi:MAG: alpha-glucosidase/alpha-galactosidase [Thermofilaceae archaeon]|nr:alpha-glucosidase/alpha-galactosidase [Thermofilaceae archaeon]